MINYKRAIFKCHSNICRFYKLFQWISLFCYLIMNYVFIIDHNNNRQIITENNNSSILMEVPANAYNRKTFIIHVCLCVCEINVL